MAPTQSDVLDGLDAGSLDWRRQKTLGSAAFREARYPDALKHFGFAIELLPLTETEEMAKLFTNCSTTYFKISELLPEKKPQIEKSLRAALKAVALNPKWWKGHFCAARCLLLQDKKDEALDHMKKVLEMNSDAERDPAIAEILRGLDFFSTRSTAREDLLKDNPVLPLVRFKDSVFLIDAAGSGHFRTLTEALAKHDNKVSFIVAPGVYNLDDGIKLQGSVDVDIVGCPGSDPDDVIVFESNTTGNNTMLFVAKATLTVTNVIFRISSPKAGGNVIRVRQAGKVALSKCEASTWSQNRPTILVMNGSLIADHLTLSNAVNTGVAVMTGGYVKLRQSSIKNSKVLGIWLSGDDAFVEATDCMFSNCGQAVSATSGSKGFKLEKCRVSNSALAKLKCKSSGVAFDCGSATVANCAFVNPGQFAIVGRGSGTMETDHCTIEGCSSVGVGVSGGVEAKVLATKLRRCTAAIAINNNLGKKVTLDHNVIQECVDKVCISEDEDMPNIEGPQHKVAIRAIDFEDGTKKQKTTKAAAAAPPTTVAATTKDSKPAQISDGEKQKIVQDVKNVLNQTKPVDDYFGSSSNKERRCANCQKVEDEKENKFKFCSSCRMACYCTPQCQKMGWKAHKKVCHKLADARKKVEEISTQMDKKRKELAIISDLSDKVGEAEEKAKEQLKAEA